MYIDKTFLATTALESFWDKSQPILFLGDWCIEGKNLLDLKKINYEVLSAPLAEYDFETTLNYIDKIYHLVLIPIVNWLNEIHETNHDYTYWEIIIGPFLFLHIQTIYDRYERLKIAYKKFPELTSIGLKDYPYFVPLDTLEYLSLSQQSDAFNLQLITHLLILESHAPSSFKSWHWEDEIKNRAMASKNTEPAKFVTQIQNHLFWYLIRLFGSNIISTGHFFNKRNKLNLMLTSFFRIIPIHPKKKVKDEISELINTPINFSVRRELSNLEILINKSSAFAQLILKTLIMNFPMAFIENYKKELLRSQNHYPYYSKAIIGTGFVNEPLRFWGARYNQKGMIRIGMQHGGPYGPIAKTSYEFLDHKFCDKYIDWGYSTSNKVIEAPDILNNEKHYRNKAKKDLRKNTNILWVASDFFKYPSSELLHGLKNGYIENLYYDWQSKVLSLLPPDLLINLTIRLRYTNFSEKWKKIQNEFPQVKFYKPNDRSTFYKDIWSAKLVIFDNLNTTYLHGFAMNIPSILFFDEKIWPIRESSRPYFDKLKNAGIFHDTPESAAEMIKNVAQNPFDWWLLEDVQNARKEYCDRFLELRPDWLKRWKNILLNFTKGVENANRSIQSL